MATFSKPLISAVALAGAAAVAVATPAIMPSVGVPTPGALSRAAYELATFSDVLSIPPVVWTDMLFGNQTWGGALSSETYGPPWAKPIASTGPDQPNVNPWAQSCSVTGKDGKVSGRCFQPGVSGILYMVSDALINGNGNGYDDYDNWPIGIVNYFFESSRISRLDGFKAAAWYALASTIGQAVPASQTPIAGAFDGLNQLAALTNVGVLTNIALNAVAGQAGVVPVAGPITSNTILAFLGNMPILGPDGKPAVDPATNKLVGYYKNGLPGALNYWVDIATGTVPFPTAPYDPCGCGAGSGGIKTAAVTGPVRGDSTETPATDVVADTHVKLNTIAVGEPNPAGQTPESTPAADDKPADESNSAALESTPAKALESTPASSGAGSSQESSAPEKASVADDVTAAVIKADDLKADDLKVDATEVSDPKPTSASDNKAVDTTPELKLDLPAADEADSAPTGSSAGSGAEKSATGASKESSASAGSEASDAGSAKSDAGSAKSDSAGGGDSDSAN